VDQDSKLNGVPGKKKVVAMINFEDLLNQIRKKIGEEIKKQDTSKEPLQLIYDLENTAIKLVE
jgi:hypothetical protein